MAAFSTGILLTNKFALTTHLQQRGRPVFDAPIHPQRAASQQVFTPAVTFVRVHVPSRRSDSKFSAGMALICPRSSTCTKLMWSSKEGSQRFTWRLHASAPAAHSYIPDASALAATQQLIKLCAASLNGPHTKCMLDPQRRACVGDWHAPVLCMWPAGPGSPSKPPQGVSAQAPQSHPQPAAVGRWRYIVVVGGWQF